MENDIRKWRFIDLFSGIGGFRLGFQKAGFKPVYSNDFDRWCKVTYEANFGEGTLDQRPIEAVGSEEIPKSEIILAGFPCQPFSMAGKQKGFNDKRGHAFFELARVIRDKQPEVIVLENVKHIVSHDKKRTFEIIKHTLENDLGYHMYYKVLNAKDYGLPQDRKRIYMVGFRDNVEFEFPQPLEIKPKIKDILDHEVDESYFLSEKYLEGLEKHKERHRAKGQGFGFEVLDMDGIAHALVVGNMGRERNLIQDKPRKHFYKDGDDKATTKNEKGVRKLTEKECSRIQGFPENFKCPVCKTKAYAQFGNAVAVPVVYAVAMSIRKALLKHNRLKIKLTQPSKDLVKI
ncbi:MAG: DNA (cytosine-5-)-methyltransferase [Candidatus Gracilibacteria bacterium]